MFFAEGPIIALAFSPESRKLSIAPDPQPTKRGGALSRRSTSTLFKTLTLFSSCAHGQSTA
jgi:hypothetical protein